MARAYGSNAQLLGKYETVYGTSPTGNYIKLPFVSSDLGSEQGLISSDLIGQGRDPSAPIRDVIRVEGNIVVPVDARNIGHWLKGLLGAPTTTGAGPYTHTFSSGVSSLPSLSLELGLPDIPSYIMCAGVILNSLQLKFARSGSASATLNAVAQGEAKTTTSSGGTATVATLTRFNQFQGYVKKGATALGNVTSADLTYSNNIERVETIRSDGKIDGADPTIASLTGSIETRFADTTLVDAAAAGTSVALEFGYVVDANTSLVFTIPEVYLPKPKLPVNGPGGVQAVFNWQASKPSAGGAMLTVVLKNDVSSYA